MANIVLTGEYNNSLDEKGRVSMPAKLRSALSDEKLIITRGIDCCLWLFGEQVWNELAEKVMQSASLFQSQSRSVMRRLIAPAQCVELDKSGRISIPQSLRDYAHLEKDCVILGINRYVEIWSNKEYEQYLKESETDFLEASEALGKIVF